MASLFSDDAGGPPKRAPFRKYPPRAKAVPTDLPALPSGWVLAHCDGGARGNPGPAGFGAVLADAEGIPLAELSEFLGFRTNNYAEYSGLLGVLAWALAHGHPRLRVVSDSELMVKQIQGKYKVNSPDLRPLFEEARRRIRSFEAFEIHHALRNKNKVADRLANEAMDRGMGKTVNSEATPAAVRATPYPKAAPSVGGPAAGARPRSEPGPSATPLPAVARVPSSERAPVAQAAPKQGAMLRGFVRGGVVHLLGEERLPENSFVKVMPE